MKGRRGEEGTRGRGEGRRGDVGRGDAGTRDHRRLGTSNLVQVPLRQSRPLLHQYVHAKHPRVAPLRVLHPFPLLLLLEPFFRKMSR